MKESATYQEIVREGFDHGQQQGQKIGRIDEVKAIVLRGGTRRFGSPDAAIQNRLEAIQALAELERLVDILLDGSAAGWIQLLGSAS